MEPVKWKPELWKPLHIEPLSRKDRENLPLPPRVKSFYDYQDPEETYEVRGILPKMEPGSRVKD